MRANRPARVDPLTWAVVAAVALLAVAGLSSMLITRPTPPTLKTPGGVVTAFVLAIQAARADEAWALIAPGAAPPGLPTAAPAGEPGRPEVTRDEFQREVDGTRGQASSRIRMLSVTQAGDAATVQLEVTNYSAGPFGGASSHTVTVTLARQAGSWLITSDPSPWQFE